MTSLDISVDDSTTVRLGPGTSGVIGRRTDATVVVSDRRVSRVHATLDFRGGTWWLADSSASGTFDDTGHRITEVEVQQPMRVHLAHPAGPSMVLTPVPTTSSSPDRPGLSPGAPVQPSSPITIGRAVECEIRLDGLVVSRRHAQVYATATGWEIRDLSSGNGTFLDGNRVEVGTLAEGSRVVIGQHTLEFTGGRLRIAMPSELPMLVAHHLMVVAPQNSIILEDVTLAAALGSLTAVVGPTGAGKSTLLKTLTGAWPPTSGEVLVDGRNLYECFDEMQLQIGYVPQDDIVHAQLTVAQALRFGAELRLPDETTPSEREARITEVLNSLGLSPHVDKRIFQLSGGQRKRVSVALELLTQPALLYLDEPTSGLDPGYEQAVMQLLRKLADDGRTILVVTHSVASLGLCDQVVFLGTGGWVGYAGPPAGALRALGAEDYPAAFIALERPNPAPVVRPNAAPCGPATMTEDAQPVYPSSASTQFGTLVRRNIALLAADRRAIGVLAAAAAIPAVLLGVLVSSDALGPVPDAPSTDARTLLGGMVVTAGVIGAANGLREIVKETPIYQRERAAGLRRGAYLASKLVVLGAVTVLQAAIVVIISTIAAGGPAAGNVLPGRLELFGDVAMTGIAALLLGLSISSIVRTSEKAMGIIPAVFIVLWLFSGTVSGLADKPVLSELAYLSPSNWGMAAAASSADLSRFDPCGATTKVPDGPSSPPGSTSPSAHAAPPAPCDERWDRGFATWFLDLVVLGMLGLGAVVLADWALARKESLPHLRRQHIIGATWRRVRSLPASGP